MYINAFKLSLQAAYNSISLACNIIFNIHINISQYRGVLSTCFHIWALSAQPCYSMALESLILVHCPLLLYTDWIQIPRLVTNCCNCPHILHMCQRLPSGHAFPQPPGLSQCTRLVTCWANMYLHHLACVRYVLPCSPPVFHLQSRLIGHFHTPRLTLYVVATATILAEY